MNLVFQPEFLLINLKNSEYFKPFDLKNKIQNNNPFLKKIKTLIKFMSLKTAIFMFSNQHNNHRKVI